MKQKAIITLLLLFNIFLVQAQEYTLSGKLTDQKTGETLFGVTIIVETLNRGSISNEYGFYNISLPNGTHSVLFSYLGYKSIVKEISIEKDVTLNLEMTESTEALNEIVISQAEGKARAKIKTPQMSVNTLSAKAIKNAPAVLGEVDVLKTITLLPGVTNAGEGASGFNVRGGAADQNLVQLDEATIYNTSHLFGFFSVFNADAIKDITLYKGGIPAKFGGRVSSVLDIRQKDGNKKEFHATGGVGLISSRLMVEGPLKKDKGSFLIAGRTSYVNLFLKLGGEESLVSFYDINTKLSYELDENNSLYLSGYFGKDTFGDGNSFSSSYGNTTLNIRWNHLFSKKIFSNLTLIYSKYDYSLGFKNEGFEWISDINNFNFKYDFNHTITNNFSLNYGVHANTYAFNPGEINTTSDTSTFEEVNLDKKQAIEPSLYIEAEHNVTNKLTLRYGLRWSSFFRTGKETIKTYANNQPVVYNSDFDIYESAEATGEASFDTGKTIASFSGLEPRFSASYIVNEQTSLKASFQRINQYLHLISNTNAPTPLDLWTPSGRYIKPQQSNQYAAGIFKNFNDEKYSLEAEIYYKTVANRIDYIDGANLIANNNIETEILPGESRAYGMEFLFKKNKGKLRGWLSYTLSKSQQRVTGRTPIETGINNGNWYNTAYDRTHDISLTSSYTINDKWTLNSNFVFQTGRPTNYPSGQYDFEGYTVPVFTTRNEERLPSYHRLDISATMTPRKNKNRKWQAEWIFGLYNIYNRNNAASITFREKENPVQGESPNEAIQTSIFGILPTITYNFKF